MGVNLKQTDKGDLELVGRGGAGYGWLPVNMPYDANSVDRAYFVADRAYRIKSVTLRRDVAGTDASAVQVQVRKAPAGTAINAGTLIVVGANLKTTNSSVFTFEFRSEPGVRDLEPGEAIGLDFTGTLTSAMGVITVMLAPK